MKLPVTINNIISWKVIFHQKHNVLLGAIPKPVENEYIERYLCQNDTNCHDALIYAYYYGIVVNESDIYTSVLVSRVWSQSDNPYRDNLSEVLYIVFAKSGDVTYRTILGLDNQMLGSRISISKNRVRLSQIRVTDPFWENMKVSNADFTEIDFVINGDGSLSLEDYPKTTQRKVQRNETFGNFVFKDQ